jgi:hypothetical protein
MLKLRIRIKYKGKTEHTSSAANLRTAVNGVFSGTLNLKISIIIIILLKSLTN